MVQNAIAKTWFARSLVKAAMMTVGKLSVKQLLAAIAVRLAENSRTNAEMTAVAEMEVKEALKELLRRGECNVGLAVMGKIAYMFDRGQDFSSEDPLERSATVWDKYTIEQLAEMKKRCQQTLSGIMHRNEQEFARWQKKP